jgi:hypothetical protein
VLFLSVTRRPARRFSKLNFTYVLEQIAGLILSLYFFTAWFQTSAVQFTLPKTTDVMKFTISFTSSTLLLTTLLVVNTSPVPNDGVAPLDLAKRTDALVLIRDIELDRRQRGGSAGPGGAVCPQLTTVPLHSSDKYRHKLLVQGLVEQEVLYVFQFQVLWKSGSNSA